ncbi:hypothetical protein SAMN04487957_11096 [Halomonas shengliensis]|uniref:Uncharacterized protein n=1 Tax=Halomonas shengliensis TaxID=419597 RepID=A0A1H0LT22_9GAMM|nr:hypothetical protein SAMN04487957_11096 [Halomonas shengliensis]
MTALEIRTTDLPCNALGQRLQAGGWPALRGNAIANQDQHHGQSPRAAGGYRYASIHHADLAARRRTAGLAAAQPRLATWRSDAAAADLHALSVDYWRPHHG